MANKILVIDDSKVIQKTVREMLPKGNFEVLEAKDGEEGLKLIVQARPNLIMLDFLLPKVSGLQVFQKIQSRDELKIIPLVLMSGRKEEVTEKIPEPFEDFEFIPKPFDQKQLIAAIKSAMAKAEVVKKKVGAGAKPAGVAPAGVAPATAGTASAGAASGELEALKAQMAKMQVEIEGLKKQLAQVVNIIKTKIK